jgi:hypothetical protein
MAAHRIVAGVMLSLAVLAWGASAQESPGPAAPAQVTSVEGLLAALADVELRASVDRDFAGAEQALDRLLEGVRAGGEARWLDDGRVTAAVGRIRGAIRQAREVDRSGLVDEVLKAAAQRDIEALRRLGDAAFDIVRDLIVAGQSRTLDLGTPERPNPHKLVPVDALRCAFEVDHHRATDVLVETREALRGQGVLLLKVLPEFLYQRNWQIVPGGSPLPPDPRLLDVLLEELRSVDNVAQLPSQMEPSLWATLAKFDAWTPELCQELSRLVRTARWRDVDWLARAITGEYGGEWSAWVPSSRPFLRSLLGDERAEVRRFAAAVLAAGAGEDLLLEHESDPDAEVRRSVARSIRSRVVSLWVFNRRDVVPVHSEQRTYSLPVDPRHRDILQHLAADPDAGVREEAARSLLDLPVIPDAGVLQALARDPDPGVRQVMASIENTSPDIVADILRTLAYDNEPLVLKAVDERLASGADWSPSLAQLMPVLRLRAAHPIWPFGRLIDYEPGNLLEVIALDPEGRRELGRWSAETGDPVPLSYAVDAIMPPGADSFDPAALTVWITFPPEHIARLLPMLQARQSRLAAELLEALEISQRREPVAAALDPLAADASLPVELRLQVATYVLRVSATAERVEAAQALLASDAVRDWEPEEGWKHGYLGNVAGSVPQPRRNALLLELVELQGLSSGVVGQVIASYSPDETGGEELTRLIVQRWLDEPNPGSYEALVKAVGALGDLRDEASAAWLRAALRRRLTCLQAVEAVARRPEPELTTLLGECVGAEWFDEIEDRQQVSLAAIGLLTGRLMPEAGEMLLAGAARAPSPSCRETALHGVETIRSYLDSVDDWQRRKTTSATRDAAVAKLVDLLRDPAADLRAEALRSLATLKAVEHLPAIIGALKDSEAVVREAARQALDRLQADPADTAAPGH